MAKRFTPRKKLCPNDSLTKGGSYDYSIFFGLLLTLIALLFVLQGYHYVSAPYFPPNKILQGRNYQKNPHTDHKVDSDKKYYLYSYTFKDHLNQLRIWKWRYAWKHIDKTISKYGIPGWIYQSYIPKPEVVKKRKKVIKEGFFLQRGRVIQPNIEAVANYYAHTTTPIYLLIEKNFASKETDFQEKLKFILAFVQDIPYAVPPNSWHGKKISGLFPPALTLTQAYGDCDSKAALFLSLLAHYPQYQSLYIEVPGHAFVAVSGIPRPYQRYYTFANKKYIYMEPAGPPRLPLGKLGGSYRGMEVTAIDLKRPPLELDPNLATLGETRQTGYYYRIRLLRKGKVLVDKSASLMVNQSGKKYGSYQTVSNMPTDGGVYYFSSEREKIYIWIKSKNINRKVEIPKGKKSVSVDFHLDRDR